MDLYSGLSNFTVLVSALLGAAVTLWPSLSQTNRSKVMLMIAFVVLGGMAILFQSLKAASDKRESDAIVARNTEAQQDLLFWQRGDPDPKNAPYIAFFQGDREPDGSSAIRFLVRNSSRYPVYDVELSMWDNYSTRNPSPANPVRYILGGSFPYIPPNTHFGIEGGTVKVGPAETVKSFAVQIACRTGKFRQNIVARKTDQGWWVFATQMRRTDGTVDVRETIFKRVDNGFPADADADLNWWVGP